MGWYRKVIGLFIVFLSWISHINALEKVQNSREENASFHQNFTWNLVDTIRLSDFGAKGNGEDETGKIQLALNAAVGKVLLISKQNGKYYLSGQLVIPSNIKIFFEKGAVFLAKNNLKQGSSNAEVLFKFESSENVVFDGNGAVFKMNKDKYSGQFNHIIMVNGARNITIKNVKALNAGGDGFYIGAVRTKRLASENIRIYNCVAKNNRRQGMSVTSVNGLYVEGCEFSNTSGTLPEAGVDIEPGAPNYVLEKIHFKSCLAKGNNGRGFQVILIKSGAKSNSVDITFEECNAIGNDIGFSNRYFVEGSKGQVRMINCIAENSKGPGFWEGSCAASGARKEYYNCTAINNGVDTRFATVKNTSGFGISNFPKRQKKILGNSIFVGCKTIDNRKLQITDYGIYIMDKASFRNIVIEKFVSKGHIKKDVGVKLQDISVNKVDLSN